MRLILSLSSLNVHHKILARPKPIRTIGTTNQRCLVGVMGHTDQLGHVGALFCAGVVWLVHSLQSPVHSTDFSAVGSANKSN